jgi:hypothetical protein
MRYVRVLVGIIFLAAFDASAQTNVSTFALAPSLDAAIAAPAPIAQNVFMPAIFADPALLPPAPAPEPQQIQGVFENYSWQAYAGYTFVRFYELPGVAENQNGLNVGVTYFYRDWVGFDIEALAAHGSLAGASSWTMFVGAGPRLRTSLGRNLEVFGHALVGGAYFSPETPYGSQGAFGYELGGGVDYNPSHSRFSLRVEGDLLGTRFFQTNQWSPKVSAGIVYKF